MNESKTIKADIVGSQRLYQKVTYLGNGYWQGGFLKGTIQDALLTQIDLKDRHFEIIAVDLIIPASKNSLKSLADDLNTAESKIIDLEQKYRAALAEIEWLKQPPLSKSAKEARKPPSPAALLDADTEHAIPAKNARTFPVLRAKEE